MTFNHFQYLPLEKNKYLKNLLIFVLHGRLPFPKSCVVAVNKLKGGNYFAQLPFMKNEKKKENTLLRLKPK